MHILILAFAVVYCMHATSHHSSKYHAPNPFESRKLCSRRGPSPLTLALYRKHLYQKHSKVLNHALDSKQDFNTDIMKTGLSIGFLSNTPDTPNWIELPTTGEIPSWLDGSYYKNGPGIFEIKTKNGNLIKFNHWFDGLAVVKYINNLYLVNLI